MRSKPYNYVEIITYAGLWVHVKTGEVQLGYRKKSQKRADQTNGLQHWPR